ncbi:MAG: DUF342 domain-containing protein [Deltaproteobacteria bacterium]|nr:DUF342 domain-containing protein [Deltaproteobacteria bacterium]
MQQTDEKSQAEDAGTETEETQAKDAGVEIEIAPDCMSAKVTRYWCHIGKGAPLSAVLIGEQLRAAGVVIEPDKEAIEKILERAAEDKPLPEIVVATGHPPTPGQDGRVDLDVSTAASTGQISEDGSIDFHERSLVQTVVAGQYLGRIIPPGEGIPGRDITGKAIPAKDGNPVHFKVGENVEVSEDRSEMRSSINGMVQFANNTLSITGTLEIPGDVDLETGNIRMTEGSLRIRGGVRSGFKVHSAGNVVVMKSVEDAEIEAGGDIEVQRGILNGRVASHGAILARFARNARIEAGGDVIIENSIINCDVVAGDRVLVVQSKGLIRGGTIRSHAGVEAIEIGSDSETDTCISVGFENDILRDLRSQKNAIDEKAESLSRVLGEGSPETLLERASEEQRPQVLRALKSLKRRDHLTKLIGKEEERLKKQSRATIRVHNIIHPGTQITIAGASMTIEHPIAASQFYYNVEEDNIQWAPIQSESEEETKD